MASRNDTWFKEEALRLVEEVSLTKADEQFCFSPWTMCEWRKKKAAYDEQAFVGSGDKRVPANNKDRIMAEHRKDIQKQRRANQILKEMLILCCGLEEVMPSAGFRLSNGTNAFSE